MTKAPTLTARLRRLHWLLRQFLQSAGGRGILDRRVQGIGFTSMRPDRMR